MKNPNISGEGSNPLTLSLNTALAMTWHSAADATSKTVSASSLVGRALPPGWCHSAVYRIQHNAGVAAQRLTLSWQLAPSNGVS